jgi:drug/metabolite transporter (DMT)-like permease
MRLAVPETGAVLTASLRIIGAALALMLFVYLKRIPLHWQRNLKAYTLAGLFGAALPFALFSYAAQHLPAAISALFNATCPLFGALFSILWLSERLTLLKFIGLLLGLLGVILLVGAGALLENCSSLLAVAASLIAPACFAISAIVVKLHTCRQSRLQRADRIHPMAMATGSMLAAAAMMLPAIPASLPTHMPSLLALSLVAALALIPSALAQILFIPLITKIGPTRAMSVSFLIPLFSMLWGFVFLGESIGLACVIGGLVVLAATGLILKT